MVLATDSPTIAFFCREYGTDADDMGMCRPKEIGEGLWLWEGQIRQHLTGAEYDTGFEGKATRVELFDERLPELFAMTAPEPEEDDRESPEYPNP